MRPRILVTLLLVSFLLTLCRDNPASVFGQDLNYEPRILLVTAHPDDESVFSATVFKTTHLLGGTVDLAIITNGEGGYRFSTLANYIYGIELDEEETGRANIPEIRKNEVTAAGQILGINEILFLDELDDEFSLDVEIPLEIWDTDRVEQELEQMMREGEYDFIFTMLPVPTTHSHHQAATLLALRAAANLEAEYRPIVLGEITGQQGTSFGFTELEGYPLTRINTTLEPLMFDRTQTFGHDNRLDYTIIFRWVVAEHKTQGAYQHATGSGTEYYFWYDINPESDYTKARVFFDVVNAAVIYF